MVGMIATALIIGYKFKENFGSKFGRILYTIMKIIIDYSILLTYN